MSNYTKIKPLLDNNRGKLLLSGWVVINLNGNLPTVVHENMDSANDAVKKAVANGDKGTYLVCEIRAVHALEMHTYTNQGRIDADYGFCG